MSTIYKNFKNIIIAALIIILVLMRMFQPTPLDLKNYIKIGGKKYELLLKKRDTVLVTLHDTIPTYIPKPYPVKEVKYVKIPVNIDTLAILKDYYSKVSYKDVVKVDKYGTGTIIDTLSQNRIINRHINWNLSIPIITETITVKELPKTQLYIGAGLGFDKVNFINNTNVGLILKTKSDRIYGLNIGVSNSSFNPTTSQLTPYIGGSIYWKIKLKNK